MTTGMEDQIPLIIVIATVLLLWAIGAYLTKLSQQLAPAAAVATSAVHAKIFANGLHVEDMSNVLIKEAQDIISRQDEKALNYFFARYRPRIIELEEYLAELRSQYSAKLGKPSNLASEADKINAINNLELTGAPAPIDMSSINSSELRVIIEKNLKSSQIINNEFMERFGGVDYYENFLAYMYLTSQQNVTIHAPAEHQYRKHLETFVNTGIALQGRKIPLKDRLEVLTFEQLKEMAKELKVDQQFDDKTEIAGALAQMPGSAVHLSMIYNSDDIFYIKAEPADAQSIEEEWVLLNAYSRLLIGSLGNAFVSFEEIAVS